MTSAKLSDDFTLDAHRITGILGESFVDRVPNVLDNTARVVVSSVLDAPVVIANGPGLEIERIPGFRADGRPLDAPGPNVELPFVFEYSGPSENALEALRASGTAVPIAILVKDLLGDERFRWNLLSYRLATIVPGLDGRKRYTFVAVPGTPDNVVRIAREPMDFPAQGSRNPATDTRIEIEGIISDVYPVVEHDAARRTLTMTFDYVEGGGIWRWVVNVATGREFLRNLSVIQTDSNNQETGRTNYFDTFPIRYEQFTGFGQVEKVKERVVIAYTFSEPG